LQLIFLFFLFIPIAALQAGDIEGKITKIFEDEESKGSTDFSDVVVFVNGLEEGKIPERKIFLNQKNKQFTSKVLPVSVGETVFFTNEDDFYHNVWSLSSAKTFDLGQYKKGESKSVVFDRPGIVKVFCNIHPEMISTILVLKKSKYALTDKAGQFIIKDVPPGEYEIRVWTEGSQIVARKVTVNKDNIRNFNMEIAVKKVPIEHLNKEGKPYPKY